MPEKNFIPWNGLLAAYVHNGRMKAACRLFESKSDWELISWNCLMGGFVNRKKIVDARWLFDKMPFRDAITWNTMISGYAQVGDFSQTMRLFDESPIRDMFTWKAIVSGYVQNGDIAQSQAWLPEKLVNLLVDYDSFLTSTLETIHGKLVDFQNDLVNIQVIEDDPRYWEVMSSALSVGWLAIVMKMLRLHRSYQLDQLIYRDSETGNEHALEPSPQASEGELSNQHFWTNFSNVVNSNIVQKLGLYVLEKLKWEGLEFLNKIGSESQDIAKVIYVQSSLAIPGGIEESNNKTSGHSAIAAIQSSLPEVKKASEKLMKQTE